MGQITRNDEHEAGRHYKINHEGQVMEMPSVTTILSVIGKQDYLVPWAVKMALGRALSYVETQVGIGNVVTEAALAALMKTANTKGAKENQRILTAAGEFGTVAHELIEDYLHSGAPATDEEIRRKLHSYVTDLQAQVETLNVSALLLDEAAVVAKIRSVLDQFYAWYEGEGFHVISTELTVYSPTYQFAGTLDYLGTRGQRGGRDLTMLDWKTSNYYSTDYALQTVAYKYGYQEIHGHEIGDIYVVRIGKKDAELQVVHIPEETHAELFDIFLNTRRLWQWKQSYQHGANFKKGKKAAGGTAEMAPPPGDQDAPPAKGGKKPTLTAAQRAKIIANPAV